MFYSMKGEDYFVNGKNYQLQIKADSFEAMLEDEALFDFKVRSGVSLVNQRDIDLPILAREVIEDADALKITWKTRSNLWDCKEYILTCRENACLYSVVVHGEGPLGKVEYFSDGGAKPSGSFYDASMYFLPTAVGGDDHKYINTALSNSLELNYMTPPALCFPFHMEGQQDWLAVGLAALDGQYNFDRFSYIHTDNSGCLFSTDFYGYTGIAGSYELPGIVIISGKDEYSALLAYSNWHMESGRCRKPEGTPAPWWRGPIFCGWGEQCALSELNPGLNATELATQEEYNKMLLKLEALHIHPTTIIIDALWQTTPGEALPDLKKWPDLRRFADEQHAKGRKVLLWFKSWDSTGLPSEECVRLWGQPMGADPTNPLYIKRMQETIHTLFSADEGCYNCDGFKIDFANCMPLGKDLRIYEKGVYGIELLKRFLTLLYKSAKAAKPDALINNSACHPYFAEVTDQVRVHDYNHHARNAEMNLRQRVGMYRAGMPYASVDTDGMAMLSRRDMMRYMRIGAELGIPDLYRITSNVLTPEDYREIAEIFDNYRKSEHMED